MSNLIKFSLFSFITCFLFFSCEKDSFTNKPDSTLTDVQRQELWNKFKPSEYSNVLSKEITPRTNESQYPSQSLLLHIANELQKADSTSAFLEDMVTAFGLPLWNYSIIKGSESSDCVVSIPFDRITSDTSISGILKYYKFYDVEEFMFVPKTELDSLVQTTLDTVAYDGYLRGILHDLVIFEFNLFEKLNLTYFNFVESGHHLQSDKILPRTRFYCIYRAIVTETIQYVLWPDGSQSLLATFGGLISSNLVGTFPGPNNTTIHIYEDCYYIRDSNYNDPLSGYASIGSNWRDWSDFFEWYLNYWNSQGGGTSGGNGSGGNGNPPPPPPPTPVEACLAGNLALSASADYIAQNLVNPCNPNEDIDELVMNALESACDLVQGDMPPFKFKTKQIKEFHHAIGAQLGIDFDMLLSDGITIEELVEALPNLTSCCGTDYDENCASKEINWYYSEPESGESWFYDAEYWEDPNLDFIDQALPSWHDFDLNFPRQRNREILYETIGGAVLAARIQYPQKTRNTCALRVSDALNKCNIKIPNIPGPTGTLKGKDNNYYFLSLPALNTWLKLTFGVNNPNHIHYEPTPSNPITEEDFTGHKGIFTMIARDPVDFEAEGHSDLFDGEECWNACFLQDAKEVNLWILEF